MGTTLGQRMIAEDTEPREQVLRSSESPSVVFRIAAGPRASDVEFAIRDARNMLALLAANVEVLGQPSDPKAEMVADDIRAGTRRLGTLLSVISELLKQGE